MRDDVKNCSKVKFVNQKQADAYLKKLKETSTRETVPVRAYLCEKCLCWHLTSRLSLSQKEQERLIELTDQNKKLQVKLTQCENRIKNLEKEITKYQGRIYELTNKKQ